MISVECYFAVSKKYKQQYPDAHFELVMRRFHSPLSPTWELLNFAKETEMPFDDYKDKLKIQIVADPKAMKRLKDLACIALEKDIFLVCYEKDATQCHRTIIKELLEHQIKKLGEK
jgi:uncharacterized protein YeaO (DUF488 family)